MTAVANDVPLELSTSLDRAKLAERFRTQRRVHIPEVLLAPRRRELYRCLVQETKWNVTLNNGKDFLDIDNCSVDERMKLALQAWQRAQNDFQYLFDNHRLTRSGEPYPDPAHYYARVVEFMNSPALLGFVREITGLSDITWADRRQPCICRALLTVLTMESAEKLLVALCPDLDAQSGVADWGSASNCASSD